MVRLTNTLRLHSDEYFIITFNCIDEFAITPVHKKCHIKSLVEAYRMATRPVLNAVLELLSNLSVMVNKYDAALVQETRALFDVEANAIVWTLCISNPTVAPNMNNAQFDFHQFMYFGSYDSCMRSLDEFCADKEEGSSKISHIALMENVITFSDKDEKKDTKVQTLAEHEQKVGVLPTLTATYSPNIFGEYSATVPVATSSEAVSSEPPCVWTHPGLQKIVVEPKKYLDRLQVAGLINGYLYQDCFGSNPQVYRIIVNIRVDGKESMPLEYFNSSIENGYRSAAMALYAIVGSVIGAE